MKSKSSNYNTRKKKKKSIVNINLSHLYIVKEKMFIEEVGNPKFIYTEGHRAVHENLVPAWQSPGKEEM